MATSKQDILIETFTVRHFPMEVGLSWYQRFAIQNMNKACGEDELTDEFMFYHTFIICIARDMMHLLLP